eukprot:TRINITY_DN1268_c0_g1_i1.p1 TRINITY_DN1268_c0_g1~~TRINITY_DN1268_c0_g1_i1.p1  ORF type:complete len:222 (+),score=29.14 TRINITY_DN1268_c0_g1_i1:93-668(+)
MDQYTRAACIAALSLMELAILVLADRFVATPEHSKLMRALVDNAAHGISAAVPTIVARLAEASPISFRIVMLQAVVAAVFSCILDADHFLAAGALSLKKATSLSQRPWLHSLPLAMALGLCLSLLCGLIHRRTTAILVATLWTTAVLTHQVRDGFRRGVWLWPVSSTSLSISYAGYMWFVLLVWPCCLWLA